MRSDNLQPNKVPSLRLRILVILTIAIAGIACNQQSIHKEQNSATDGDGTDGSLSLAFSTYLGGPSGDTVRDIATDSQGNVYLTGGTASSKFPVTTGAYDTTFNGWHDVYVMKLDPTGNLIWSTVTKCHNPESENKPNRI